jgi:hypothetical protein
METHPLDPILFRLNHLLQRSIKPNVNEVKYVPTNLYSQKIKELWNYLKTERKSRHPLFLLVQKKISKIEAFVNFILEITNPKYLPKGIEYAATPEIENNGRNSRCVHPLS